MQNVYIIGIGQLPVSKYPEEREYCLATHALENGLVDAGIEPERVSMLVMGTMLTGILGNQQQVATRVAEELGLAGIEATTVDAACASGGAAARLGYMAVAGGFHECVAVSGVERMTHKPHAEITAALATASDWPTEGSHGATFISLNAQLMQGYMAAYGVAAADFAPFSLVAHQNGLHNPNAFLKKEVDFEKYIGSRLLVEPIRLMDAPPICDGAAAIILGSEVLAQRARAQGRPVIQISGSAVGTDTLSLAKRHSQLELAGARLSAQRAFSQAGLTPDEIDFFELHDAYTIISALSLEAAGFAKAGQGVHFAKDDGVALDGKLPIATMGGLKARGHPVGATGVYQLVEATQQLWESAGVNQIDDARTALVQSIGGTGATVVSHILQRVD